MTLPPICREGRLTSHVLGSADRSPNLNSWVMRGIPVIASLQSAASKSLPYCFPSQKTAILLVDVSGCNHVRLRWLIELDRLGSTDDSVSVSPPTTG